MEKLLANISSVLLELHQGECLQPLADFQHWALGLLRKLVYFDSAFWGSGNVLKQVPKIHHVYLYNQPAEMLEVWRRHLHLTTDMNARVVANIGRAFVFPFAEISQRNSYPLFWQIYGIDQLMTIYLKDEKSGLHQGLSLYRQGEHNVFSEQDRLLHQFITPYFVQSYQKNWICHLQQECDANGYGRGAAVCDRNGVLHFTTERFVDHCAMEWSGWSGPELPEALNFSGEYQLWKMTPVYRGKTIAVDCCPWKDLYLMHSREMNRIDKLSQRELEIAQLYGNGSTCKEIALQHKISPATVRNHLASIYLKLGVDNKGNLCKEITKYGSFCGC